jgi:hypothetical protein
VYRGFLAKIRWRFIDSPVGIIPLVRFRILFGGLMMLGAVRFIEQGWIEKLYIEPDYFFKFYWFEWVKPFDEKGMYILLSIIIGSSFMVMLGLLYRIAIIMFFVSFTYLELIDATNYLNHHYLVCLLSFLMIFLPANKSHSVDVLLWRNLKSNLVPSWTINILIFQLTVVYTFAGIAKLNYDWIFNAMPLAVWLPERQDIPIIGYFFQFKCVAFLMSWVGAIYDLSIAYFLMYSRTRPFAYFLVIVFHLMTWLLFNIGLFPWIMIVSTMIFFPGKKIKKTLSDISKTNTHSFAKTRDYYYFIKRNLLLSLIIGYMLLQIIIPFRHFLYPSNVFWSEEGYRFSWRVMLVEKIGQANFTLKDPKTNRQTEIINSRYLTQFQEKQMSIQPDFILQFAHYLRYEYKRTHGIENPIITVDSHVALNGRVSQPFIDKKINIAEIKDDFLPKKWILKFNK